MSASPSKPTGASASLEPLAPATDGAMAQTDAASAPAPSLHHVAAPLAQTLQPAEPLNGASPSPLVGTEPGMIHPDVWAVLDDLADGMSLTQAASLVDRPFGWLRDNTRNQAVKRELAKRVAHIGQLRAIRAWKRVEELSDQTVSYPTALRAAIHLTSEHNPHSSPNRGLSDTQRGKSVVVVLNRRRSDKVGTVLDGRDGQSGEDSFTVHVSEDRHGTRVSVSTGSVPDEDGSDVIDAEAIEIETPKLTPALVKAAVRAGLDAASLGDGLDDADPDDV
jgi:hypothetical protein